MTNHLTKISYTRGEVCDVLIETLERWSPDDSTPRYNGEYNVVLFKSEMELILDALREWRERNPGEGDLPLPVDH